MVCEPNSVCLLFFSNKVLLELSKLTCSCITQSCSQVTATEQVSYDSDCIYAP